VAPGAVPGSDREVSRLQRVFRAYERRKGDAWDYDDYRSEAATAMEEAADDVAARLPTALLPELAIFDGFRELAPLDLRLADALALHLQVEIAVAAVPPGREPDLILPKRSGALQHVHRFANPVAEARWVLRDVKAELAAGAEPLDLALIVPPGRARAIATLADEYGVPLMDETPRGLADLPEGGRLLNLLELADAPTASRLLGVPELHGLGAAALDAGVAGLDAVTRLADERGEQELLSGWLERLEPREDALAWGAGLIDAALEAAGAVAHDGERAERFHEQALTRLAEARRVATGPGLRPWWAALLKETVVFDRPNAGVALLHAVQASGRRFAKVWIVGATEGAHLQSEREDYFVPEEDRTPWDRVFERPSLPKRFLARRPLEGAELRVRGDVTVVTFASADQAGRAAPDLALVGPKSTEAPSRPAGSRLDLGGEAPYRPPAGPVELGPPTVERLGSYARCGLRAWARQRLCGDEEHEPWWRSLRRTLRGRERWTAQHLRDLGSGVPEAADWLERHAGALAALSFGVRLRDGEDGPPVLLDAAGRSAGRATLVRFVAPDAARDQGEAEALLDRRSSEYWAAGYLCERHRRTVRQLRFQVWPILADPIYVPARGWISSDRPWSRFARVRLEVSEALPAWSAGEVTPSPGYVCRDCQVFDLCREGRR